MNNILTGLAAGAFVAAAFGTAANAADIIQDPIEQPEIVAIGGGFYVAARAGASFVNETTFDVGGALGVDTVENDYDTGYFGALAAGYDFGNNFRAELEFSYMRADIDTHTANLAAGGALNFTSAQSFGEITTYTGMINGYYDFDLGALRPFVGAGIGYGRVKADGYGVTATGVLLDDSDSGLAYQLSAGINYDLTETVTLELGYRYQAIEADLNSAVNVSSDFDFDSHNVFAGVRVKF